MIYPKNFEDKIGFDQVRISLSDLCLSSLGKEKVDKIRFSSDYDFITILINQVAEFRDICLMEDNFPLSYYYNVTNVLNKIKVIGSFPEVNELYNLKRSLETIRSIVSFFKNKEEGTYPYLNKLVSKVDNFPFVHDRINSILSSKGSIKDNASEELRNIRREILSKQGSASKTMSRILRQAQKDGLIDEDLSPSVRDGRVVLPVPATHKRKLNGIIHDESATGKTVFIEPNEVVEINNRIKELEYSERREIVNILTLFANDVRPYVDELLSSYDFMATIDVIRAKALYAIKVDARKPLMLPKQIVNWRQAKHPLLLLALKKENKSVVPLDIRLNQNKHLLLISGPNAGGKSVCLKTVGMLQYMFQCGLLVPALDNSEFGIFQQIFIDIGDEQSIENDLSTYSSHLFNMKHFTKFSNHKTLLLIDEFGTGTEPTLGAAIAESVLEELNNAGAYGVITTHYSNLKHFASSSKGIENGAMMFDTQKIEPLFKLEIGRPGSSFAFEIARKIGLSEKILKNATEKVGEEQIDFDKHLREILRDKKYIEDKRDKIRKEEKKLQRIIDEYSEELSNVSSERKDIIKKAKTEANEILNTVNKTIESTVREIKESQAEKEKTKKLRSELLRFKEKVIDENSSEEDKIQQKINRLKEKEKNLKSKNRKDLSQKGIEAKIKVEKKLVKGDKVKMINQNTFGEILEINGKNIQVAFGNLITTLSETKIELVSEKEYKSKNKSTVATKIDWERHDKNISFKSEIDLRGNRAEEAMQKVQDFIDQAYSMDIHQLRILHGKGDGILRQIIREYLKTFDIVKSFKDEDIRHGGTGITIVELD